MKTVRGQVAVVTGAAGGLGRALALVFARAEMDVVLADLDEPGMEAVAQQVRALGRRVLSVRTDVQRDDDLERLLARALEAMGAVHILCNNAGIFTAAPMIDAPLRAWQRVLDVNLWGVIHGSRVFGEYFVRQGRGHIVNTASAAGTFPVPGMCAYSTSKFAVIGFSRQLRWELGLHGVGVTVLCPGVLRTRMASAPGVGLEHFDVDGLLKRAPTPEGLAALTLRAIRKNRDIVYYGFEAWLFWWLRLLPSCLIDPLARMLTRKSLTIVAERRNQDRSTTTS